MWKESLKSTFQKMVRNYIDLEECLRIFFLVKNWLKEYQNYLKKVKNLDFEINEEYYQNIFVIVDFHILFSFLCSKEQKNRSFHEFNNCQFFEKWQFILKFEFMRWILNQLDVTKQYHVDFIPQSIHSLILFGNHNHNFSNMV